jgi:hypothetical protein
MVFTTTTYNREPVRTEELILLQAVVICSIVVLSTLHPSLIHDDEARCVTGSRGKIPAAI